MNGYRYAYCLFCNTGKEECVVRFIHENDWGHALFPQRTKTVLKNGKWVETPTPLLPGYVFVYSEENDVRREQFLSLNHVIRVLSYNDGSSALMGHDLEFADWLWRLNGRIDVMKAIQVGERVEIVDGIFKQLHGTITRMDRRRRTVRVELDTQGALRHIWLAYEIVEKLEDKSGKAL